MQLNEAKDQFSKVCEAVAFTGEAVVVTRRGKPLVKLVAMESQDNALRPDGTRPSVWDTVRERRAKYGPLTEDFELPERDLSRNSTFNLDGM